MTTLADIIRVKKNLEELVVGESLQVTGVILDAADDMYFIAGDDSGFIIEVACPFANSDADAEAVLAGLTGKTFTPYEAESVLLDPSAELGDYFVASNFSGGIFTQKCDFYGLMSADISIPYSEEDDHEFEYVPAEQRQFVRTENSLRAQIIQSAGEIRTEVSATYATKATTNAITGNLNSLSGTVDGLANDVDDLGEAYLNLNTIVTDPSTGLTEKVGALTDAIDLINDPANGILAQASSQISQTSTQIMSTVSATYATKTTTNTIAGNLNSLSGTVDDLADDIDDINDPNTGILVTSESYFKQNSLMVSSGVVTTIAGQQAQFHWGLTAAGFKLYTTNPNAPEFSFTPSGGLVVKGSITADSGKIGQWVIDSAGDLYNGIPFEGKWGSSDPNSGSTGMGTYGGSWAMWAGDGRFRVNQSGNVVCRNIQIENGGSGSTSGGGSYSPSTVFSDDQTTFGAGIGGGLAANNVFSGVEYADCLYTHAFISDTAAAEFYRGFNNRTTVFHMAASGYTALRQVSLGTITDSGGTVHRVLVWS